MMAEDDERIRDMRILEIKTSLVPLLQLTGGVTLTNYRLFEIHFP